MVKMIEKPTYEKLEQRVRELEKAESERKLTEEALFEKETKFRLFVQNMNDILWTADLGMKITYLSPSIEKVLGFTVEERLKQSLHEQMPPETLQLTAERLAEEIESDGERDPQRYTYLEIDYYHKDGSLRCLETALSFIRDEHGKPLGIHGISRDITERKKAEEALRESENKYRFITEWMTDIVWTIDLDLRATYLSPSITRVFGFTPEERMQQEVAEIMTPESYSEIMSCFTQEMEKEDMSPERSVNIDAEFYHKDGHTVWMESLVRPILDYDGSITGIHGVSRDITERKRIEETLRESEEKHRILFEHTGEALFVAQDGKIVFQNPRSLELTGYRTEEFQSRPFIDFLHEDDREIVMDSPIHQISAETPPEHYTFRIIHSCGSILLVQLNSVVIRWNGKPATLNFMSDITERKKKEEERESLIADLQSALSKIKTLSGLLPICSHCKKIRDDKGYWQEVEAYIRKYSEAKFSHSICQDCAKKYYPDFDIYED